MTKTELFEYIKNRKYHCSFCIELQKRVINNGLDEIKNWKGMICGSIEDMQIRLYESEE